MINPHMGRSGFTWQVSNISGTRPAANIGTVITPNATLNTKGSYSEVLSGATLTKDVYGLLINFNSNNVAATAKNTLVDIGVDPSGGSSYSILIPDLLASCASTMGINIGINYYFPIWVRAGSSIAARAAQNSATTTAFRCCITAFGAPADPKNMKVGTSVVAFGITSGSSSGTAVTSGTSSEGNWTTLSSSISDSYWYWQLGMGINDSTMTANNVYFADFAFGDASNKHLIIHDQIFVVAGANESLASNGHMNNEERLVKSGNNLYMRLQCSGTADSSLSLAAYGLKG